MIKHKAFRKVPAPCILPGFAALTALASLSTGGCAGPTTPLGAVWGFTPARPYAIRTRTLAEISKDSSFQTMHSPVVQFSPVRQVLHGPSRMRLFVENIYDGHGEHELSILYNGFDVTPAFLLQATVSQENHQRKLSITVPVVRLAPDEDHRIEVYYRDPLGSAHARLEPPICYASDHDRVQNTGGFRTPASLIQTIEGRSTQAGLNPALLTGLIAQESGFNPKALSWAKAMGLTQITPIAEAELLRNERDWPRYPGLNELSLPAIKALIHQGRVNAKNEWRLHPEHSIEGGVEYLRLLSEWWDSKDNNARIERLFADPQIAQTKLVLASYHSGYSRVQSALQRHGTRWLRSPNLKEARKYVNRIMSYCTSFSQSPDEEMGERS